MPQVPAVALLGDPSALLDSFKRESRAELRLIESVSSRKRARNRRESGKISATRATTLLLAARYFIGVDDRV